MSEQSRRPGFFLPGMILLLFWVLLSPYWTLETLLVGGIVAGLVTLYNRHLLFSRNEMPGHIFILLWPLFCFFFRFLYEVIRANVQVVRVVLSPKMAVQPQWVRVPMRFTSPLNAVLFANCTTLTPGTLTVSMNQEEFLVHALTDQASHIEGGSIETALLGLERKVDS